MKLKKPEKLLKRQILVDRIPVHNGGLKPLALLAHVIAGPARIEMVGCGALTHQFTLSGNFEALSTDLFVFPGI